MRIRESGCGIGRCGAGLSKGEANAMNRVVVDTTVLSKLDNLSSALELCDEAGVTLGYFLPAADRQRGLYDWAQGAFSDEEIEAARQQSGGVATEELLARLNAR
jgi:hypothetical protein